MRLKKGQLVPLEELDRRLDVPVARFRATVTRLLKAFRAQDLRLDIAGYRRSRGTADNVAESTAKQVRGNLYQLEIRRFPPMDRAEEFRMARRHEFLRTRAVVELERAGIPEAEARELAARPRSVIDRELAERGLTRRGRVAERRYLERCLSELEELRNLYVEGALYLVLSTVHRYQGLGVDTADLIQEGNASLFQAIEGFDWRRDVRFKTYAQYWVHQAVLKMLYNSSRTVRVPVWVQKALGKIRRLQEAGRAQGRDLTHEEIGQKLDLPAERIEQILTTKRYAVSLDAALAEEEGSTLGQMLADEEQAPIPDTIQEGDLGESLNRAMADLPDREKMILRRRFGLGGGQPETLGEIAVDLGITAERVRQLQNAALLRLKKPGKRTMLAGFVE